MSVAFVDKSSAFLDTGLPLFSKEPYKVADMRPETVAFGRKELELALYEMPGLQACIDEFGADVRGEFLDAHQKVKIDEPVVFPASRSRWACWASSSA